MGLHSLARLLALPQLLGAYHSGEPYGDPLGGQAPGFTCKKLQLRTEPILLEHLMEPHPMD
jgi:hypothetical protein